MPATWAIREKAMGPRPTFPALAYASVADFYKAKGDLGKAEQLYTRSLELWAARFGPDHRRMAPNMLALAEVYDATGRAAAANDLRNRVTSAAVKSKKVKPSLRITLNRAVYHRGAGATADWHCAAVSLCRSKRTRRARGLAWHDVSPYRVRTCRVPEG